MIKSGFKIVFEAEWNTTHKYEEIEKLCNSYSETTLVCMAGQKQKDSGLIDLCAISPIQEAFKKTSSLTEAHPVGNVYWYCVPDRAFGFAETKTVDLSGEYMYDTVSSQKNQRMSWSFVSGGYRIGDCNGEALPYRKYLLILEK